MAIYVAKHYSSTFTNPKLEIDLHRGRHNMIILLQRTHQFIDITSHRKHIWAAIILLQYTHQSINITSLRKHIWAAI